MKFSNKRKSKNSKTNNRFSHIVNEFKSKEVSKNIFLHLIKLTIGALFNYIVKYCINRYNLNFLAIILAIPYYSQFVFSLTLCVYAKIKR